MKDLRFNIKTIKGYYNDINILTIDPNGSEVVSSYKETLYRGFSVGYSAEEEASLERQFAVKLTYDLTNYTIKESGQRNGLGANSTYYVHEMSINDLNLIGSGVDFDTEHKPVRDDSGKIIAIIKANFPK